MATTPHLLDTARRWLDAEPDADMRDELAALLSDPGDELAARFDGRLQFGTAGLRAEVGAGPLRMNRLVVRQAAAGLVDYLLAVVPGAAQRGVLIGYDARRKSDLFALDTARVCAARGVRALLFDTVVPTPLLAWSITHVNGGRGAAGGVMVTASHNPPADNGYKVYLGTGAQIVPPADVDISACIDRIDPCTVELAAAEHPLIERVGVDERRSYLAEVGRVRRRPEVPGVQLAYTALHGVGGDLLVDAFAAAGLSAPVVVESQHHPDGRFPTVAFPNPEEPGAMDLLLQRAASSGASLALANDPDADRLGVAIPQSDGSWRRLFGDEVGWLMADHVLRHTTGGDRLVVTTLVSSSLLSNPGLRFVFGYEQALGYLVAPRPLDKDGITAAVLMAEIAAVAAAEGFTLQDRLDALAAQFGRHVMAERSLRMEPADGRAAVAALRASPPATVDGVAVTSVDWFDEAGLLRLQCGESVRLQVRPSGTEPKVKLYGEGVDRDPGPLLDALAALLG